MIPYSSTVAETSKFPVSVFEDGVTDSHWLTYEEFVCNLVKEMGSRDNNLAHMVLGIAGESGEIVDAIKKKVIYDKPLDVDNIIEELGDLEFYMAGMRQLLGLSRVQVLAHNVAKLGKRYADGYSDAAAIARADKKPSTAETAHGIPEYQHPQGSEAYQKLLAEQKPGQAINLPAAAVEGTDDMAGVIQHQEPTTPVEPETGSPLVPPLP